MTKTNPLMIAMIGLADLEDKVNYRYDPMLYPAFMLISTNLVEATYYPDEFGFDNTTPLEFNFTDHSIIFRKNSTQPDIVKLICDHLLPSSDGVIVSLGPRGVKSDDTLQSFLREIIRNIYETRLPTVFTDEYKTIVDQGWTPELTRSILEPPAPIVASIAEIFPRPVPVLGYHYGRPISIQNILTTLLGR